VGTADKGVALNAVHVYTDGASRGNPGPAGIGVVVCDKDDRILRRHREFLGEATNNEAEYRAILRGLKLAAAFTEGEVELTCDSQLAVRQLAGTYRIRERRLSELVDAIREAGGGFARVTYRHAPRMTGRLALADRLANEALDRRGS
jgi:ribonuclease HI